MPEFEKSGKPPRLNVRREAKTAVRSVEKLSSIPVGEKDIVVADFDGVAVPYVPLWGVVPQPSCLADYERIFAGQKITPEFSEFLDRVPGKVRILTGRKKIYFEKLNSDALGTKSAKIHSTAWYPDTGTYEHAEYIDWKVGKIEKLAKLFPGRKVVVIDDDGAIISAIQERIEPLFSNVRAYRYRTV